MDGNCVRELRKDRELRKGNCVRVRLGFRLSVKRKPKPKDEPATQVEFTRRWSLHVLQSGFTHTGRFGGWSNTNRAAYLD